MRVYICLFSTACPPTIEGDAFACQYARNPTLRGDPEAIARWRYLVRRMTRTRHAISAQLSGTSRKVSCTDRRPGYSNAECPSRDRWRHGVRLVPRSCETKPSDLQAQIRLPLGSLPALPATAFRRRFPSRILARIFPYVMPVSSCFEEHFSPRSRAGQCHGSRQIP